MVSQNKTKGAARMPRFVFDSVGTDSVSASAPAEPRRPRSLRPEDALVPQATIFLYIKEEGTQAQTRENNASAGERSTVLAPASEARENNASAGERSTVLGPASTRSLGGGPLGTARDGQRRADRSREPLPPSRAAAVRF